MSSVSRTRATNLTGLIDIDALVEANLLRQKTKLNTATQKMKVEQYRQEQYREVITKSKTFYNKYCDILSSDSLFKSSNYNTIKYTSSDSSVVTATGSSTSNIENYKVNVAQMAEGAKVELKSEQLINKQEILIKGKQFTVKGDNTTDIVKNLNADLSNSGLDVTVKYSKFANNASGGFVIETKETGETAKLNIALQVSVISVTAGLDASTAAKSAAITKDELINNSQITINGQTITLEGDTADKKIESLAKQLKENNPGVSYTYSDTDGLVFTATSNGGSNHGFSIFIGSSEKTVTGGGDATQATASLDKDKLNGNKLVINGKEITVDLNNLSDSFRDTGVSATLNGDKLVLTSDSYGKAGTFTCLLNSNDTTNNVSDTGENAIVSIENGSGQKIVYDNVTKKLTGNEVTIDGTTFTFTGVNAKVNDDNSITSDSPTVLTGKTDGTELKDKIVEFINDYNELLGHINGKLYEEYDRSYLPLTDEDKEGLTDSEIEKLETKAKTGLLRNDSYLRNFADDMKLTMTTMLENSGLSLEKIGINPVNDYKARNGLFTIDEDKLLAAIEENPDGIKELFSGANGIVTKLKDNLYQHATGTFSKLANKAGVADGVTAKTNEMTKDIDERKKLITQMQTALKEKEDALYSKYSRLESSLASIQSQQSSLSSYFQ